jgi:ribosomal protein S18 acetylase RimI-like enzyme
VPVPTASEIEEAALKSWPAIDTVTDGRWVIRAAGGYTKRSNSVQSLDPADDGDAEARIARAARWYRDRQLPPVFRVTPLAGPNTLAAIEGWRAFDHSKVLAMDLGSRSFAADENVALLPPVSPDWLAIQQKLQGYDDATRERLKHILERIKVPARGLIIYAGHGVPVAAAVMIVSNGIIYTGNVVTSAEHRRQGHARKMLETGMAWARRSGGRRAAINVAADNSGAIALYKGLGYAEHYDYHYRSPGK